ncbi:MAG TPA: DUF2269 family protein [Solirubrobacteraceae bacterium]|nr:DUF2269 family protein [Solirubrobacteraceae bacterium]
MISATSAYEVVLAIHVMAVVVAFGVTFAYPIMFAVAARHDPRSLPLMHRVEYTIERFLVNPGLLAVVAAGIFLASDGHHWSDFFVQWGLAATIVIGALVGAVMIPTAKRAEEIAARDVGAAGAAGEGTIEMSAEYQALVRRLSTVGTLLSLLVLVTILFMAIKP